jgi:pimeloyl-ACP methyl ester carboxylesterase
MGAAASMLSWEDEFCERMAAGPRFVIRYDHRDTGRSVGYDPGNPPYDLRDLVADAVGLLDTFGLARAHFVGMSMGGAIAQIAALEHPDRVASLTLIATSPGTPRSESDLPAMSEEDRAQFNQLTEPDWSDRATVIDYMVALESACAGRSQYFDEAAVRDLAGHIFDRTANIESAMTNHLVMEGGGRWRDRLAEVRAPTLVVHGTNDPVLPYGNAIALANEIPETRLVPLEKTGHDLPRAVWDAVVPAIVAHTSAAEQALGP